MPSHRDLLLLFIWLVAGAAILLLASEDEVRGIAPPPPALATLGGLEAENIQEVRLTAAGDEFILAREGAGWVARDWFGHPAETEKVEALLELLLALDGAEPRGSSRQSHSTFEVTDSDYRIELRGDGKGLPFFLTVGKVDAFDRFYARFGDDDEVYSLTPNLRLGAEIGKKLNPEKWLELALVEIPEMTEITGFRMETPDGVMVVDHVEEETTTPSGEAATVVTWKVTEPEVFEAELSIVQGLKSSVRNLRATSVADPARLGEAGLEPARKSLAIFIRDGEPIIVDVGNETETADGRRGVFGRRRGSAELFILPTWLESNLFKSPDQLRRADPVPPPPPTGG